PSACKATCSVRAIIALNKFKEIKMSVFSGVLVPSFFSSLTILSGIAMAGGPESHLPKARPASSGVMDSYNRCEPLKIDSAYQVWVISVAFMKDRGWVHDQAECKKMAGKKIFG